LQAYYINLAHRTDRRASMEAQFEHLGLAGKRVEATLAKDLPAELLAQHAALGAHMRLSLREFSVGVNHRKTCSEFLATQARHALILEDDIVLSGRISNFLEQFERNDQGIDLLRIETFNAPAQISRQTKSTLAGIALHSLHGWTWGSAAYIISRRAAQAFVDRPEALNSIIDRVLYRPHRTVLGPIKRLQLVPALAIQSDRMDGAVWGGDSDLTASRSEGLAAPKPTLAQAVARFIDNEIMIGLPTILHRAIGLSHKRHIPFDAG
jgi:glycosyl transferase family 25